METSESAEASDAGRAWVHRYLLPHIIERFSDQRGARCLQVAPDDPTEAAELGSLGYDCTMANPDEFMHLPLEHEAYDFVFTGRFSALAQDRTSKIALAREFWRVLRPGGSLLLAVGNRLCPIDLSRNGPLLHPPGNGSGLSWRETQEIFMREGGFGGIVPLSPYRHFSWYNLPSFLRPLGKLADVYWRYFATPSRLWLYGSPINPIFLLWIKKD